MKVLLDCRKEKYEFADVAKVDFKDPVDIEVDGKIYQIPGGAIKITFNNGEMVQFNWPAVESFVIEEES